MHKLMSKPITRESFEMDDYNKNLIVTMCNENGLRNWYLNGFVDYLIEHLESLRFEYLCYDKLIKNPDKSLETLEELKTKQYQVWKELVRWLPESWLQTRTVTMNYENLFAICSKSQRRFHKLNEWSGKNDPTLENFIAWARTLPYAFEFIFTDEYNAQKEAEKTPLQRALDALRKIGVSVRNADGSLRTIAAIMEDITKSYQETVKTALADKEN